MTRAARLTQSRVSGVSLLGGGREVTEAKGRGLLTCTTAPPWLLRCRWPLRRGCRPSLFPPAPPHPAAARCPDRAPFCRDPCSDVVIGLGGENAKNVRIRHKNEKDYRGVPSRFRQEVRTTERSGFMMSSSYSSSTPPLSVTSTVAKWTSYLASKMMGKSQEFIGHPLVRAAGRGGDVCVPG